jgi:hypothetical protein
MCRGLALLNGVNLSPGEWNSRNHTNKVRLRGLRKNQGLKPTQVGFACVDAVSNRLFYYPAKNGNFSNFYHSKQLNPPNLLIPIIRDSDFVGGTSPDSLRIVKP